MTDRPPHRIETLAVSFTCAAETAGALQSRFSRAVHGELRPRLDGLFDALGLDLRLDTLTVDIGSLDDDLLEREFVDRVISTLATELRRLASAARPTSSRRALALQSPIAPSVPPGTAGDGAEAVEDLQAIMARFDARRDPPGWIAGDGSAIDPQRLPTIQPDSLWSSPAPRNAGSASASFGAGGVIPATSAPAAVTTEGPPLQAFFPTDGSFWSCALVPHAHLPTGFGSSPGAIVEISSAALTVRSAEAGDGAGPTERRKTGGAVLANPILAPPMIVSCVLSPRSQRSSPSVYAERPDIESEHVSRHPAFFGARDTTQLGAWLRAQSNVSAASQRVPSFSFSIMRDGGDRPPTAPVTSYWLSGRSTSLSHTMPWKFTHGLDNPMNAAQSCTILAMAPSVPTLPTELPGGSTVPIMGRAAAIGEPVIVEHAGLVLIWPWLARLYAAFDLPRENGRLDRETWPLFAGLLAGFLARDQSPDYTCLSLAYPLCGIALRPHRQVQPLTEFQQSVIEDTCSVAMGLLPKSGRLTAADFAALFLSRRGVVRITGTSIHVEVEPHACDVLLADLAWPIAQFQFPWTSYRFHVAWDIPQIPR